ncbi:hypothetical protein ERJ75_001415500 [Trypanosoma vivax]|nr:hypothetical protein ERJ75_001415500 [Trypanosoma vivax]
MHFSLDVFFFFMRIQFLPYYDKDSGCSRSACAQFMTRLREHLLRADVHISFLSVILVLILISAVHRFATRQTQRAPNLKEELPGLQARQLFCRYFPALIVAFLTGSPLQSLEELVTSFAAGSDMECIVASRLCDAGAAEVQRLFALNHESATLWTCTLNEVIAFGMEHMTKISGCTSNATGYNSGDTFQLIEDSPLDEYLHIYRPTTLNCMLVSTNNRLYCLKTAEERTCNEGTMPGGQRDSVLDKDSCSQEFHCLSVQTSTTDTCKYFTLYFSLLALANMECFTHAQLSHLLTVLETCCAPGGELSALNAFATSAACESLPISAHELMKVVCTLVQGEKSQLLSQAVRSVREEVKKRDDSSPVSGV